MIDFREQEEQGRRSRTITAEGAEDSAEHAERSPALNSSHVRNEAIENKDIARRSGSTYVMLEVLLHGSHVDCFSDMALTLLQSSGGLGTIYSGR